MACFLDTNILIYAVGGDPAEATKREKARELLDRDDVLLSVQVLQEFYVQATRPNRPGHLTHALATGFIAVWRRFPVQDITVQILLSALAIKERYRFSYWDSAILAAARAMGAEVLYSEDMADGRIVDGVRVTNPFR